MRKRYQRVTKSKNRTRHSSKPGRIEGGFTAKLVALHKHALQLSSATTISAIAEHTLDAIEFSLGFDFADIVMVEKNCLKMVDHRGFDRPLRDLHLNGKGVTVRSARKKLTVKVDDTRREGAYVDGRGPDWKGYPSMLSELAVPVLVDGKAAAVLNVESRQLKAFTDEDQHLLETLASHVAMAIGRLRRDEALYTSRGNLQALFNATTDAAMLMGLDGTVLAANEGFADMFRKEPEEIVGAYAYSLIPADSAKKRKTIIDEVIQSGKPSRFEDERAGAWFENSIYPIFDSQGKITRLAVFVKNITGRKRMEDELRKSVQFMESIVENANVWMDVMDREGNVIVWNRAAEAISGYSSQEVTGNKKIWEWLYPDPKYRKQIMALPLDTQEEIETNIKGKNGGIRTISWRERPILDGKGGVVGSIVIGRDITKHKEAEAELLKSTARLNAIIDGSSVPQFAIDKHHEVIYWNRALEEYSGIRAEDVVGTRNHWKAFFNQERPCMADLLIDENIAKIPEWYPENCGKSKLATEAYEAEDFSTAKDKKGDWLAITAAMIRDDEGKIVAAVETLEDITERKQAEQKLRESEERYRSLYENSIEGILLTATNGRILAANPEACRMLQRTEDEIRQIGRNGVVDLTDPRLPLALEERARTGTFKGELNLKRKDGSVFPAEIATNVFEARGEPTATCMIIHDISERKQMEDRLNSIHEHGLKLAYAKGIDEIIKHTLDAVEFTLGLKVADFALSDGTTFRLKETRGIASSVVELPKDGPGIIVKAANTQKTITINDTREEPAYVDSMGRSGMAATHETLSEIAVPVLVGDVAVAVLNVESASPNAFTSTDEKLLETLASHVASALTRLGQQGELARYSEHLEDMVKERTRQLTESELRFRELANLLPQIIFEIDATGNYTFVNRSGITLAGYTEEEVRRGLNALQTFITHDHSRIKENIGRVLSGEDLGPNEYTALRKDGTTFPVMIHSTRIVREGRPIGIRGIAIDISEQKRLEKELRASRQRLEYIVTSNPAVVYTGSPNSACSDFKLTYLSDSVIAMLGFEPKEFVEHRGFWDSRVHPDDLRSARGAVSQIKEGRYTCDYRFLHKDGRYRWLHEEARLVRDVDRRPLEVIGCWTDITEFKEIQQRLSRSERLATIGQAAAMVGHDLRNPLQSTANTVYLVRRLSESGNYEDRKEMAGLLDELDNQVYYMDKIVSDLQDYSRPVGNEPIETNLPNLIKEASSSVQIPKTVHVSTVLEGDLTNTMINPILLKRVLLNLIMNGVQAMPKGGQLTINATKTTDSVIIRVQDSGVGIDEATLGKLFNPFFTTKARGQGLGLAVCKRLIEAQGGTITVQSKLGEGTTFTLRVPSQRGGAA